MTTLTIKSLEDELASRGVRADSYCLNGGFPSEQYCIDRDGRQWLVYYSERGLRTGLREFAKESDACKHLLSILLTDSDSRPDPVNAHKHSSNHREEIERSELCGCFYCLSVFPSSDTTEWIDKIDGVASTVLCPSCGIDSVIGSASGYPITKGFLKTMHQHWF